MNDQREKIKYFPVVVHDQSFGECQSEKMTKSTDTKININNNVKNGRRTFLYAAVCTANLAAFTCGVALGWSSPAIPKLNGQSDPENNPLPVPINSQQESWLGSLLPLGAALGPFAVGLLVDRVGRKKSLLISVLPFIIAFYMSVFINDVNIFFLMRFLCGLATGGVFAVLPVYIGEISDDSVRGALGIFFAMFISFGILFAYITGPYISLTIFNAVCSIVPTICVPLFMIYLPESPHYLIASNYEVEAEEALMKIRQKSRHCVQKELLEIKDIVKASMENKGSFLDIFKSKGLTRALVISTGLVIFQQLSGINVVLFYTQTIFAVTGSTIPPEVSTIITGAVQVLSTLLVPVIVDKTGKRCLLLLSAVGMGLSECALGLYFYLQNSSENIDFLFWLPIVSLVTYYIAYCIGFGPLPWALLGELFPPNIKSVSSTITASTCWILGFVITNFFGNITEAIGIAGSFWVFAGCCVLAFVFVLKWVPETSGKSLQEIQDILYGNI